MSVPLRDAARGRLERRILADDAYEMLKALILDQSIPADSRLSIDALAAEFGVSQTPIREAMARLESDGLVIKRANGRYRTAPLLDEEMFEHLYDIRLQLEPFAAACAARRITAPDLDILRQADAEMRQAPTGGMSVEYGRFAAIDAKFHDTVAAASGNPFVKDAVRRLHSHYALAHFYRRHGVVDAREAVGEHQSILAAIEQGDAAAAESRMRAHIQRSRRYLRDLIKLAQATRPKTADARSLDHVSRRAVTPMPPTNGADRREEKR